MKKLFICLVGIILLLSKADAIIYDSSVLDWSRVIIRVDSTDTLQEDALISSWIAAQVVEILSDSEFNQGDNISFVLPGGFDGEEHLRIPGIPDLIPDHQYLMFIPPTGISEVYMGPIIEIPGEFTSLASVDESAEENSLPSCPYSRWNSIKWTYLVDSVPFKYYSGFSTGLRSEFDAARDTWNGQSSEYIYYNGTTSARVGRNNKNTIDFDYLGQEDGVLAYTRVWADSFHHILEADVVFNFSFPFNTSCSANSHDFRSVAIHELGHVLGLGHVSDTSQVMFFSLGAGQCKRTLGCGDIAGVKAIYGDHYWNWTNSTLGCSLHDAVSCGFVDGCWKINPGSSNPYIQFPSITITQSSHYKYVKIVGKSNVSVSRTARIFYRCSGQSSWPSDQYKEFPWNPVDGVINVTVSMGTINASKPWISNQIVQIRLVLPPQYNNNERDYLDHVKILNNY